MSTGVVNVTNFAFGNYVKYIYSVTVINLKDFDSIEEFHVTAVTRLKNSPGVEKTPFYLAVVRRVNKYY